MPQPLQVTPTGTTVLECLAALSPGSGGRPGASSKQVFAAKGVLPADLLRVEVSGVGLLAAPLAAAQAQALLQASAPARFGRREQTLLDATVRHTGEIDADAVGLGWADQAFAALQRDVAAALGLDAVQARLHNLLVYGPGQFFKLHQDTEKHPGMVATLVLVWPSAHIGGTLVVRHGSAEESFVSQQLAGEQVRWFAFYADCRHEVQLVEEGWRVALTFDLVLPASQPSRQALTSGDKRLVQALALAFGPAQAPRTKPWVLLLEHEYTQHGLRWPLLKGKDRLHAQALAAAAGSLGLNAQLALAELHESWTAVPASSRRGQRGGDHAPDELIDRGMTLDFWVDAQGPVTRAGNRVGLAVDPDDVQSISATGPQHLVDEQYEGYMGNYGETLDFWYRRAALVLQSPLGRVVASFKQDFNAALKALATMARRARKGKPKAAAAAKAALAADADGTPALHTQVATQVAAVADLLAQAAAHRLEGMALLPRYAEIAMALQDDAAAARLLRSFNPAQLDVPHVAVLVELQTARGPAWLGGLVRCWLGEGPQPFGGMQAWAGTAHDAAGPDNVDALPRFVEASLGAGLDAAVVDDWLRAHQAALTRRAGRVAQDSPAGRALHGPHLLASACALARGWRQLPDGNDARDDGLLALAAHVASLPKAYPPRLLAPLVLDAGPDAGRPTADGPSLRQQVCTALQACLALPERAPDDHALRGLELRCSCRDCAAVRDWVASPSARPLVLAMAESRRTHVQEQLQRAAAPVAMQTLRVGSPYKLQLTKASDLHATERAERQAAGKALQALTEVGSS